jgi:hypothetical protein
MLPRPAFAGLLTWGFHDVLNPAEPVLYVGDDLLTSGFPVTLNAYGAQIFVITRSA